MAKCQITGKKPLSGNRVSHAKNKRRHQQKVNMQSKRVWDDAAKKWVRINVSTRGLKMLNTMPLSELRKRKSI